MRQIFPVVLAVALVGGGLAYGPSPVVAGGDSNGFRIECRSHGTKTCMDSAFVTGQAWSWSYTNLQNDDPSPRVDVCLNAWPGMGGSCWVVQPPNRGSWSKDIGGSMDVRRFLVARVEVDGSIFNQNDFEGDFSVDGRWVELHGAGASPGTVTEGDQINVNFSGEWAVDTVINISHANGAGESIGRGSGMSSGFNKSYSYSADYGEGIESIEVGIVGPDEDSQTAWLYSSGHEVTVEAPAPIRHFECRGTSCTRVNGPGPDTCSTHADCGGGGSHFECRGATCQLISSPGADTCSTDADCGGGGSHKECGGLICRTVSGPGPDTCSTDADCVPQPPTCTFDADPGRIVVPPTTRVSLDWTCVNATACAIDQGVGPVSPAIGGSVDTRPTSTRTYVLSCSGPGGSVQKSTEVRVFQFVGGALREVRP